MDRIKVDEWLNVILARNITAAMKLVERILAKLLKFFKLVHWGPENVLENGCSIGVENLNGILWGEIFVWCTTTAFLHCLISLFTDCTT